jgi:hypothetical protein
VREIQAMQSRPPPVILQTTPVSRFVMRWVFPLLARTGVFGLIMRGVLPRMALGTTEVRLAF